MMMTSKWFWVDIWNSFPAAACCFARLFSVPFHRLSPCGLAGDILRAKRRRSEIDTKAGAPDADGLVFVQVGMRGHVVVLVALVALERTEVDKSGLSDGGIVVGHLGGDQVDMHVGAIGSFEVAETECPLAVRELMNCRDALRLVSQASKVTLCQNH